MSFIPGSRHTAKVMLRNPGDITQTYQLTLLLSQGSSQWRYEALGRSPPGLVEIPINVTLPEVEGQLTVDLTVIDPSNQQVLAWYAADNIELSSVIGAWVKFTVVNYPHWARVLGVSMVRAGMNLEEVGKTGPLPSVVISSADWSGDPPVSALIYLLVHDNAYPWGFVQGGFSQQHSIVGKWLEDVEYIWDMSNDTLIKVGTPPPPPPIDEIMIQLASVWDYISGCGTTVAGAEVLWVLREGQYLRLDVPGGINEVGRLERGDRLWLYATQPVTLNYQGLIVELTEGWNNDILWAP